MHLVARIWHSSGGAMLRLFANLQKLHNCWWPQHLTSPTVKFFSQLIKWRELPKKVTPTRTFPMPAAFYSWWWDSCRVFLWRLVIFFLETWNKPSKYLSKCGWTQKIPMIRTWGVLRLHPVPWWWLKRYTLHSCSIHKKDIDVFFPVNHESLLLMEGEVWVRSSKSLMNFLVPWKAKEIPARLSILVSNLVADEIHSIFSPQIWVGGIHWQKDLVKHS